MSRAPLTSRTMSALTAMAIVLLVGAGAAAAAGPNPHVDPSVIFGMCGACHDGHGASRSPMLPTGQADVCLTCHGSRSSLNEMIARGMISGDAQPPLLDTTLSMPYSHPVDHQAFSRHQPGAVTCTSCHSPHRGSPEKLIGLSQTVTDSGPSGRPRLSARNPNRFEYELCQSCHGSAGVTTQNLTDISRLLSPENRSFHPVEAAAVERSPSVRENLSGRQINCSDCHGSSRQGGPRGPHASDVPYLLRFNYVTADGSDELPDVYALCYKCHKRQAVLDSQTFLEHGKHIVDYRASCATCHNAHGSVNNRALIRFGEETTIGGVEPSSSNRLELVSTGPGSGACYLSCHGVDHDPKAYGAMELLIGIIGKDLRSDDVLVAPAQTRDRARRPIGRERSRPDNLPD